MADGQSPPAFLSYAFRPFFLFGALFAIVGIGAWVLDLHGIDGLPLPVPAMFWHAHEMIFGFGGAAIAGFLFTAIATWTGRPPLRGTPLAVLLVAWLAGRAALAFAGAMPAALVAVVDLIFWVLVPAFAAREVIASGNRRNFGVVAATAVIGLLDLAFHVGRLGIAEGAEAMSLQLAVHVLLVLITVIGGRIVPSFTANWLRVRNPGPMPVSRPWIESAVVPLTVAAGIGDALSTAGLYGASGRAAAIAAGVIAIATGLVHAIRLAGWRGTRAAGEPLLAILHAGYGWMAAGYVLLGLTALGLGLPRSAALHALTMGTAGVMILGVTTRVALGHTGRPLAAARTTVIAYVLLNIAVLVRVLSPLIPGQYLALVDLAALGWMAAFALFLVVYLPILVSPRIP